MCGNGFDLSPKRYHVKSEMGGTRDVLGIPFERWSTNAFNNRNFRDWGIGMTARVVKSRKDPKQFTVEIKQGVQYFRLDYCASKEECKWMADMFRKALESHDGARA